MNMKDVNNLNERGAVAWVITFLLFIFYAICIPSVVIDSINILFKTEIAFGFREWLSCLFLLLIVCACFRGGRKK